MRIYLSIDNGAEVLQIPVVPSEFTVSKPQNDETFETISGEELAFIDVPGLKSISWSSFFPMRDYPYIKGERLADMWQYGYIIDKWIELKYPIRLIITGTPINMACKVTQFDYKLGTDGDIHYDITLKEFPLVDTETEELTVAQYEELLAKIESLELEVSQLKSKTVINTPDEGAPFYSQTLQKLVDKGYLNGDENGLALTEEMARILTIVDRAGGLHTGMIYNYNDSNIPEEYRESVVWFLNSGYVTEVKDGGFALTEDMMRILKAVYTIHMGQ